MLQTPSHHASRHPGRAIILCIVLLLLVQVGLGFLNLYPFLFPQSQQATWLLLIRLLPNNLLSESIPALSINPVLRSLINMWTVGMALCYFLAAWFSALYTTRGYSSRRARSEGALIGAAEGIGSVALTTLLLGSALFWYVQTMRAQVEATCGSARMHWCGLGFGWMVAVIIPVEIVRPFLLANILGIILTPLGGLLAGDQRVRASRSQGEHLPSEEPVGSTWSRGAVVVFLIAALLAVLLGGIGILLALR